MAECGESLDEVKKKLCELCLEDNHEVKAEYFCLQCEQNMCLGCEHYHRKVRVSKSHEVIGIDEGHNLSSLTLGSETIETHICKEHGTEIKFFCKEHMVELCLTCKLMKHKRCGAVVSLEQAANDVFDEVHYDKIGESMEELLTWFEKCKEKSESEKKRLGEQKQNVIANVKSIRKTLNEYIKTLEADALKDIETVCEVRKQYLDDQIHICDSAISGLRGQRCGLNTAMSLGNAEDKFIEANKSTRETIQYCSILNDMLSDMNEINVLFTQNALEILKEALPKLGLVERVQTGKSFTIPGKTVIYNHEVKVQTASDKKDPYIADYKVLADGRQLVLDWANRKLKLFDKHANFVSELFFQDTTKGLASFVVQDNQVIVSTGSTTLYVLDITDNGVILKETRQADISVYAIAKYKKDMLAITCSWYNEVHTISVMDTQGHAQRNVLMGQGQTFKRPYFITYEDENATIYVLDLDNGLYAMNIKGNMMYNYHDPVVKEYFGLGVSSDRVFIGVKITDQYEIRVLNKQGKVLEDLNHFKSLFPLNMVDQKLVLGSFSTAREQGRVGIYKLIH